ncbi:MAG: chloride channel protein [Gammaproteobacteria bacterium]|nr:chloride channel protein [Gammaproteobacteria bacterium]
MNNHDLKRHWHKISARIGLHLANANTLPLLSILGLITGSLVSAAIITLLLIIEAGQTAILSGNHAIAYAHLPLSYRFLLPVMGGLVIGLILHYLNKEDRQLGITHVIERLHYHQAQLPVRNAVIQFITASLSIISGHSVGREGPGVHIGAATGSWFGQWLKLPNHCRRTLVACGVAASIAASFNTPLAGVIFAMEVIMMEYTMVSFAPVILAAVSATSITQAVLGHSALFSVSNINLGSIYELPWILLTGLIIGVLAALFTRSLLFFTHILADHPIWQRTTIAGIIVGICALPVPSIMGVGYDVINEILIGEIGILLLLTITLVKILATTAGIGLGIPGGLIAPTFLIGAAAGGSIGIITGLIMPGELASSPTLFVLIGICAMMGATLHAPLAALIALLELSGNPGVILPGMLAVIGALLVNKEVFGRGSVFIELMRARGLEYKDDPVTQGLQRISVTHIMERSVKTITQKISPEQAARILKSPPVWLLLESDEEISPLLLTADLENYMQGKMDDDEIDLLQIPAQRLRSCAINLQASLHDALKKLDQSDSEALHIQHQTNTNTLTYGILTRDDIKQSYRI